MCCQVFRDAAGGQVVSWMRTLEEESGIVPLWEVMFQLMCHPVPQVICCSHCNVAVCDPHRDVMHHLSHMPQATWLSHNIQYVKL